MQGYAVKLDAKSLVCIWINKEINQLNLDPICALHNYEEKKKNWFRVFNLLFIAQRYLIQTTWIYFILKLRASWTIWTGSVQQKRWRQSALWAKHDVHFLKRSNQANHWFDQLNSLRDLKTYHKTSKILKKNYQKVTSKHLNWNT